MDSVHLKLKDIVGPVENVIEIGANEGTDTNCLLQVLEPKEYFAFEPDDRAAAVFEETINDDRVTLFREAISDQDGETSFYAFTGELAGRQDWNLSGSILKPKGHLVVHKDISFKDPIKVKTCTFDSWFQQQKLQEAGFIWMDVQGAEHLVFEGMKESLDKIRFIYTEFDNQELYKGQKVLEELLPLLPNFLIHSFHSNNVLLCNVKHPANQESVSKTHQYFWQPNIKPTSSFYQNLQCLSDKYETLGQKISRLKPATLAASQTNDGSHCFIKLRSNGQWFPITEDQSPLVNAKDALYKVEALLGDESRPVIAIGFNPGLIVDIIFNYLKETHYSAGKQRPFYIMVDDIETFFCWLKMDDRREILNHNQVFFFWHEDPQAVIDHWDIETPESHVVPVSTKPFNVLHTSINRLNEGIKSKVDIHNWLHGDRQGAPPHQIKIDSLLSIKKEMGLNTFVETGTYLGQTLAAMRPHCDKLYSIELSEEYYANAQKRFRGDSAITLLQGDSGERLKDVIDSLNEPALFWLDAHYSGGNTARADKDCPIYEELDHIFKSSKFNNVLIIDDARLFGSDPEYPTIENISKYIIEQNKEAQILIANDSIIVFPEKKNYSPEAILANYI